MVWRGVRNHPDGAPSGNGHGLVGKVHLVASYIRTVDIANEAVALVVEGFSQGTEIPRLLLSVDHKPGKVICINPSQSLRRQLLDIQHIQWAWAPAAIRSSEVAKCIMYDGAG